ncbi:MAG: phosphate acetyltransferase [Geminicoccaceae bacterium]|nr:phosphate acetyltransferase [Geminicoccaceae bacterium]
MTPFDRILDEARADPRHLVMAEGEDPRIVAGSARAVRDGVARITLVGSRARVEAELNRQQIDASTLTIVDPADAPETEAFAQSFFQLRKHKGIDEAAAAAAVREPLTFAALMVREGHAEGTIGGAVATTADTVRAALQIIGRAAHSHMVSSFFLMLLDKAHHPVQDTLIFADCGLVVEPEMDELAEIARASAGSYRSLVRQTPRVAMLSFSTHGSARHARVIKVAEATRLVREKEPDLLIDGDLQFDAAFVPAIAKAKAPSSPIEGAANVFVFPSLEAANIAYKVAERIGGAKAIGPILQGLAEPANDLSRGCSADDVHQMIAVTVVQAQANRRS